MLRCTINQEIIVHRSISYQVPDFPDFLDHPDQAALPNDRLVVTPTGARAGRNSRKGKMRTREGKLRPLRPTDRNSGETARRPFQIKANIRGQESCTTDIMTDILRAV